MLVTPAYQSCKVHGRLCQHIDVYAADYLCRLRRTSALPLDELKEVKHAILSGFVAASARSKTKEYPTDGAAFLALLTDLHALLFQDTGLPFGGRFRLAHETVYYGREEREGAKADDIEPALVRLFDSVWKPSPRELSRENFVQSAARFLHRFFCIHPFQDGNGRIARFVLQLSARASGRFSYRPLETYARQGRLQRQYLAALRYADRHTVGYDGERVTGVDPYKFLYEWLDPLFEDASNPEGEAPPPEEETEE